MSVYAIIESIVPYIRPEYKKRYFAQMRALLAYVQPNRTKSIKTFERIIETIHEYLIEGVDYPSLYEKTAEKIELFNGDLYCCALRYAASTNPFDEDDGYVFPQRCYNYKHDASSAFCKIHRLENALYASGGRTCGCPNYIHKYKWEHYGAIFTKDIAADSFIKQFGSHSSSKDNTLVSYSKYLFREYFNPFRGTSYETIDMKPKVVTTPPLIVQSKPLTIQTTPPLIVQSKPLTIQTTPPLIVQSKPLTIQTTHQLIVKSKPRCIPSTKYVFTIEESQFYWTLFFNYAITHKLLKIGDPEAFVSIHVYDRPDMDDDEDEIQYFLDGKYIIENNYKKGTGLKIIGLCIEKNGESIALLSSNIITRLDEYNSPTFTFCPKKLEYFVRTKLDIII